MHVKTSITDLSVTLSANGQTEASEDFHISRLQNIAWLGI